MADVSKIQGAGTPPEPGGKKEKQISDEFKKKMQKVEKPSGADAEQKNKRKRREEVEEESEPEEESQVPLSKTFSLSEEDPLESIFDVRKSDRKIAGPASVTPEPPKVGAVSRPPLELESSPSVEEENEDDLPLPPPSQAAPQQQRPSPQPSETPPQAPENAPLVSHQADGSLKPQQLPLQEKKIEGTEASQKKKAEVHIPGMPVYSLPKKKKKAKKVLEVTKEKVPTEKIESKGNPLPIKQPLFPSDKEKEKEAYFAEMKRKTEEPSETGKENEEAFGITGFLPPQISIEKGIGKEEEEKKIKEEEKEPLPSSALLGEKMDLPPQSSFLTSSTTPTTTPSYAYLHPQVLELFERMVGAMTIATYSGVTETTISLNSPQFASSVFYGAQIILREYSTAPKIFNIELLGTPQAVALFQGNADDLMAAFQSGNYNFRVNQLQTGLLRTEKPMFHRKDKPAGGQAGKDKGKE